MRTGNQTLRPAAISLAIVIVVVLVLQGFSVNGGLSDGAEVNQPVNKALTGWVYWPNGTLETTDEIFITITNNETGDQLFTSVNAPASIFPDGNYQRNLDFVGHDGDVIFVNCTFGNMLAVNETVVSALPFFVCDLHLFEFPFGPKLINKTDGGSITGYNNTVTLDVPPDSLASDTVIFGTYPTSPKPGALASINLGPEGTSFSTPATISWSLADLDLDAVSPQSLVVYTSDGGPWTALPTTIDRNAGLAIFQVSHFSNFSLASAGLVGLQSGLSTAYRGTTNNPVLDLTITNLDLAIPDMLDYIHVVSNCTDDLDVTGVSLWNDTNDNAVIDAPDIQIGGTQPLAGGNTNFTALAEVIPASSSLNLLVSLNVAAGATIGNYLDLFLPMNSVGMVNAGLNLEQVDPAGNTTVIQELGDPHVIYGVVSNIIGPVPYAWLNLTNNRTGAVENLMTDDIGRYDVNLGLMTDGYLDGDEIFIAANDSLGQTGWNITYVDIYQFGERCDILVISGPVASNETPADGSIIADLMQDITIEITPGVSPVNTATIILEVDGLNYTWPDPVLSYAGDILTFDSALAFGAWSMGQIVNVTLWQANDTFGNPCVNVPYSWTFSIIMEYVKAPANLTLSNNASAVRLDWDSVNWSFGYNVYRSADRFGAWPWAKLADNITATNWTDAAGTYDDPNTYYYIVKAWNPAGEGANSSMGTKARRTFTYNDPGMRTNSNWISLPYKSSYTMLSDIVMEIEGGLTGADRDYIAGVYYWDAATQQRVGITWGGFGWNLANDKAINPGDGICLVLSDLMSVGQQFNWTIAGTDVYSTQNFTYLNPALRTNSNWISVPYSGVYQQLSDIVLAIEGGLTGADRDYIAGVYYWDAATQQRVGITWGGFGWNLANDITIKPGDGICLVLSDLMTVGQTFSWDPALLTQPVPDMHYYD